MAEVCFESLDASAQGGLGEAQAVGGHSEVTFLDDGEERPQALDVHAAPLIRFLHQACLSHALDARRWQCHGEVMSVGTAFNDLGARFGLHVLGTLDDVFFQSGPSFGYPWTCYILATAPHHRAVQQVVGQLMDVEVAGCRLWRYAKIEARVGPPLDFGTS
jgi:hypothetical protein